MSSQRATTTPNPTRTLSQRGRTSTMHRAHPSTRSTRSKASQETAPSSSSHTVARSVFSSVQPQPMKTQGLSREAKRALATMNRTNHVDIPRQGSICGAFMIDPGLDMPAPWKPTKGEKTPNLRLTATEGDIDVDVYLVSEADGAGKDGRDIAILIEASTSDSLFARIHALAWPRPPLWIRAIASKYGSQLVVLHIPRSFGGRLEILGDSRISHRVGFSAKVAKRASLIREEGQDDGEKKSYFVRRSCIPLSTGKGAETRPGELAGCEEVDRLEVDLGEWARLHVQYDDEVGLDKWRTGLSGWKHLAASLRLGWRG
ncbi:hypothetical protein HGRIS_012115 [Hohenbuehelia grisea]|uniref:DUF7330 domain-containing protein n=1 Tax=Hohenbuehelia grisea TaxID=104357 RepID=A0ABR3IRA1_9AGAR